MKKYIVLIITILCLFTLVGCNKQVDEEQWKKIFNESNFKNCTLTTITNSKLGTVDMTTRFDYSITQDKIKVLYNYTIKSSFNEMTGIETTTYYTVEEDCGYRYYLNENNKWYKESYSKQSAKDFFNLEEICASYSKFSYDKKTNEYTYLVENEDEVKETIVVTLDKKKVVKITDIIEDGLNTTYTFNYDKVQVVLPEGEIKLNTLCSETEWKNAFKKDAFNSCEIRLDSETGEEGNTTKNTIVYDFSENIISITYYDVNNLNSIDHVDYYEKNNNETWIYAYDKVKGVWVKSKDDSNSFDSIFASFGFDRFINLYNDFNYISTYKYYSGNIDVALFEISFKEGKLAKLVESNNGLFEYTISKYNAIVVSLPERDSVEEAK